MFRWPRIYIKDPVNKTNYPKVVSRNITCVKVNCFYLFIDCMWKIYTLRSLSSMKSQRFKSSLVNWGEFPLNRKFLTRPSAQEELNYFLFWSAIETDLEKPDLRGNRNNSIVVFKKISTSFKSSRTSNHHLSWLTEPNQS